MRRENLLSISLRVLLLHPTIHAIAMSTLTLKSIHTDSLDLRRALALHLID
jgi:hypothetical protein